jgi:predicted nucleic acid-binding protein
VTSHLPKRVFLDTNVYVIGAAFPESPERVILSWAGFAKGEPGPVEIIVSEELFEQIRRVSKRVGSKDWAGQILGHVWQDLRLCYVILDPDDRRAIEAMGSVPREDIGIYLTAREGNAQCFVSTNHELIAALAKTTGEFECLTPDEFVRRYLT